MTSSFSKLFYTKYLSCFSQFSPHYKPPVYTIIVSDVCDPVVFIIMTHHVTSLIRYLDNKHKIE